MRKRLFRAFGVAFLVGAGLAGAIIPGVAAAAPVVPGGQQFKLDFPAGEFCAFPVEIAGVDGQVTHDTGTGDMLVIGPAAATVTNLDTGAMRTFNVSGPTHIAADGSTVDTGPFLIGQPASRNVGPPFLIYTTGQVTFTPEDTIATRTGAVTDVCAELS